MAFPGRRVFLGGRQEGEQKVLNGKGREQPKSQLGGKKHQGKRSKGVMGRGHSSSPLLDLQPQRLCAVHHMQRKRRQCPSSPSTGSRAAPSTFWGAEAALKQLPPHSRSEAGPVPAAEETSTSRPFALLQLEPAQQQHDRSSEELNRGPEKDRRYTSAPRMPLNLLPPAAIWLQHTAEPCASAATHREQRRQGKFCFMFP